MLRPVDGAAQRIPQSRTRRPEGPADRFEPAEPREPTLADAARLLDSRERLHKATAGYRLSAWAARPDGGLYAAYTGEGERAYLASIRPDGTLAWELPWEGRLERLRLQGDLVAVGGQVVTAEGRRCGAAAPEAPLPKLPDAPKEKNTVHTVVAAWPLPGGDTLVEKRSVTTVYPPFHHGMEHDPMFGGANLQYYLQPEVTERTRLVRLSPEGEVRWEADSPKPAPAVLPDGTAFVAGEGEVLRLRDGRVETAFQANARTLLAGRGDTLLVRIGDTVSRRTPDGATLASVDLERPELELKGEDARGRLIFADEACLWSYDGQWRCLTDPVGDHSVALALRNAAEERAPAGEVVPGEGRVVIGGVTLPVRR